MRIETRSATQTIRKPQEARPRRFPTLDRQGEGGVGGGPFVPPAPLGGPLGLRDPGIGPAAPRAADLVDRLIVGKTREGLPEVRLDVAVGALRGTEIRLAAGPRGLEATFVAASEAARRVVEAQLADLARALESRGLQVARCEVTARPPPRPAARDRGASRSWEDAGE